MFDYRISTSVTAHIAKANRAPIDYPFQYFSFIHLLSTGARERIKFAYNWITYYLISNPYNSNDKFAHYEVVSNMSFLISPADSFHYWFCLVKWC